MSRCPRFIIHLAERQGEPEFAQQHSQEILAGLASIRQTPRLFR